ncbi:MAG: hypothetical protein ABIT08_10430 [Bacteroidia bacterium]
MKTKIILSVAFSFLLFAKVNAQQSNEDALKELEKKIDAVTPATTKFLLSGYAQTGLEITKDATTFNPGSFSPIFLWKTSDKIFFEGEMEMEFEDGELNIGIEYADISYKLCKNFTVRAGKILLPYGIFTDRLHPAWINKFPTKPLGFDHGGVGPTDDVGFEILGGVQLGNSKASYSLYAVNGPSLMDGSEDPMQAGMLNYENLNDNNKNKAVGGRIGFLPFTNSCFEIGFSGQFSKPGNKATDYEKTAAFLYAVDLTYVKSVEQLKGTFDIKAQYNGANVDNANYANVSDSTGETFYTFDNKSTAYFAQFSYRPTMVTNKILKNFEIAARYSSIKLPEKSLWADERTQWTIGLDYWLSWRTVFKLAYAMDKTPGSSATENTFIINAAMGF